MILDVRQELFDFYLQHDRESIEELMTEYPGLTCAELVDLYHEQEIQWDRDHPELDDREPGAMKQMVQAIEALSGRVQVTLHRSGISAAPEGISIAVTGVVNLGLLGESDDLFADEDIGDQCAFAAEWLPEEAQAFGDLVRGWQADHEFRMSFFIELLMLHQDDNTVVAHLIDPETHGFSETSVTNGIADCAVNILWHAMTS